MVTSMHSSLTTRPRPFPNSYWVTDTLLAGEYPGALDPALAKAKVIQLLSCGVSYLIDLTEPWDGRGDGLQPYHPFLPDRTIGGTAITYCPCPIPDINVPRSRQDMIAILDSIDHATANGCVVYVHCWGGVGRTGVVVGCYLVRYGMTGGAALATVHRLWHTTDKSHTRRVFSPETLAQQEWVRTWHED
jgi:Dual specificity phosphatase, catalytic domain